MSGALLDTHALLWLVTGEPIADAAIGAILEAQRSGRLLVSPISGWEMAVASQKRPERRPDLGGLPASRWFRQAIAATGASVVPISSRIALEAAEVATVFARKDPGDCFLIATARARRVPIITRDGPICNLARDQPDYLRAVAC